MKHVIFKNILSLFFLFAFASSAYASPVKLNYSDFPLPSYYYKMDVSEAKVNYSFELKDGVLFKVEDRDFAEDDRIVFTLNPYSSFEVKYFLKDLIFPTTGTCTVNDLPCSSEEAQNLLADFYSEVLAFGESSLEVRAVLDGYKDIFIEANQSYEVYQSYDRYLAEVESEETEELDLSTNDPYEWFLLTIHPSFYQLSQKPSSFNKIYSNKFYFDTRETRGGEIHSSFLGGAYSYMVADSDTESYSFGNERDNLAKVYTFFYKSGFRTGLETDDTFLWDFTLSVGNLGRLEFVGTADDFPCLDEDGDGKGVIEALGESCEAEVATEEENPEPTDYQCIDTDGDGWGWIEELQESCKLESLPRPVDLPTDYECVDNDGDGWGWISALQESCKVETPSESIQAEPIQVYSPSDYECIDADGDGWGWIEATKSSCRVEADF